MPVTLPLLTPFTIDFVVGAEAAAGLGHGGNGSFSGHASVTSSITLRVDGSLFIFPTDAMGNPLFKVVYYDPKFRLRTALT